MMNILFFVKTVIMTIALVLVLQIRVGEQSLEAHSIDWVQSSSVIAPLNSMAHGAAKFIHDVSTTARAAIEKQLNLKAKPNSPSN